MQNLIAPKCKPNNPAIAGKRASAAVIFGDFSRFSCFATHTRFGAVAWFVQDVEKLDDIGLPTVLAIADTFAEAIARAKVAPL